MRLTAAKRLLASAALALCIAALANPNIHSGSWQLNGNGYPGAVNVQQAADGTLGGTIYGEPLSGYYAAGERAGVWLRGAPPRPTQAYVGVATPDGASFAGRLYGLNGSTSGATVQRNVFAFAATRAPAAAPAHPGVPAATAGPASVAGNLTLNANNFAGALLLSQAADGSLSGTIYGDPLSGHYAPATGTIAFLRFSGDRPVQLYVGTVTPQGMNGEFYALTVPAGASAQRMRYAWSAQAAAGQQAPYAANSGISGGALMASINEPTAAQCLARCQAMAGCTGFQFSGGALGGPDNRALPGATCLLFSGAVGLRPLPGVTACVMPCDASRAPSVIGSLDPKVNRPLAPGRPLPPPAAPTPPPTSYIGPVAPRAGTALLPPLPAPAAPPSSAPAPGSAPAPAPTVARLSGFEIVVGPTARIAPLSISDATAACPPNKVAISAGYRVRPLNADPQYGVEVKGAMPEGDRARVRIRNANVFVAVEAEAIATCIDRHPGVRTADAVLQTDTDQILAAVAADCGADRVIGGGFMGETDAHPVVNAPTWMGTTGSTTVFVPASFPTGNPPTSPGTPGTAGRGQSTATFGFVSGSIKATPLPGRFATQVRGTCAPAAAVPDWEAVAGQPQTLGGRSTARLTLQCPSGKRMLSRGLVAGPQVRLDSPSDGGSGGRLAVWKDGPTTVPQGNAPIALISNALEPQGVRQPSGHVLAGAGVTADVSNRDIAGNSVAVMLAGVCAAVP